mmetsp:Transcript_31958/g.85593  ORF Transcript_31958/g.85593 Transcript_31958/m.85593 type:complete len:761 (-) Transcript_31958:388-2670(-)
MRSFLLLAHIASHCLEASGVSHGRGATEVHVRGETAFQRSLAVSDDDVTKSPVKRVVELLQKIAKELQSEAASESSSYDQMACWCKNQEKEKQDEVSSLKNQDSSLMTEVGAQAEKAASSKVLQAAAEKELQQHKDDLASNQHICDAQEQETTEETKDMRMYITSLKNAITVLSRHQGNFLQINSAEQASVRAVMRSAALRCGVLKASRTSSEHVALLTVGSARTDLDDQLRKFLGEEGASLPFEFAARTLEQASVPQHATFLQSAVSPHLEKYSVQSGEVVGILKQMLSDFEENLADAQETGGKNAGDCKATQALKQKQIDLAEKAVLLYQGEAATADSKGSEAKRELDMARSQQQEAEDFLRNLRLTCSDLDTQWETRSKTRGEELRAVQEALAVLTEDDAREHLQRQYSFVQMSAVVEESSATRATRSRVVEVLRRVSAIPADPMDDLLDEWKTRGSASSPRTQLSSLAVMAQLDSFTEVKKAIDKMITDLKAEGEADVTKKELCTRDINAAEKNSQALTMEIADLRSHVENLKSRIATLETEIAAAQNGIADVQTEVKKRGEQRDTANAEFQQIVSDQRATQEILAKAVARLQAFYNNGHKAAEAAGVETSLVQERQTPPVHFNTYSNNRAAPSVISLLEQIIADSKTVEQEASDAEAADQKAYESFVTNSNQQVKDLQAEVQLKSESKSDGDAELLAAETGHSTASDELANSQSLQGALHQECDWLLQHFDVRNRQRLQEIEAIQQAKSILSGAE